MDNEVMMNAVEETVETANKMSWKTGGIIGLAIVGAGALGYTGYKAVKSIVNKAQSKKAEEAVENYEEDFEEV